MNQKQTLMSWGIPQLVWYIMILWSNTTQNVAEDFFHIAHNWWAVISICMIYCIPRPFETAGLSSHLDCGHLEEVLTLLSSDMHRHQTFVSETRTMPRSRFISSKPPEPRAMHKQAGFQTRHLAKTAVSITYCKILCAASRVPLPSDVIHLPLR